MPDAATALQMMGNALAQPLPDPNAPAANQNDASAPANDIGQKLQMLQHGSRGKFDYQPPTSAAQPTFSSILANTEKPIAQAPGNILGAPVDLVKWAINNSAPVQFLKGEGIIGKEPIGDKPFMGSEWMNQNILPGVTPQNMPERIAAGIGQGIAGAGEAMTGGGVVGALAPEASALANVGKTVADAPVGTMLRAGAVGGGAGQAASEAVPEPYKPYANIAGNIAGGGLATLGEMATAKAASRIGKMAKDYVAPLGAEGQQRLAGQQIANAASDAEQLRTTLANSQDELVPGSQPTTFQATGDTGIGQLERVSKTRNAQSFLDRAADQNAARTQAVENLQPTGNPQSVGNFFTSQLEAIDNLGQQDIQGAQRAVTAQTAPLADTGTPQEIGADIRSASPASQGQPLPGSLAAQRLAAKNATSKLWQALPQDAGAETAPLKADVGTIYEKIPDSAAPVSGEEAAIIQKVNDWPAVQSFPEAQALRSRISAEIGAQVRSSGTENPVVARLTQTKQAVDNWLSSAVDRQSTAEQQAVKAGTIAPEDAQFAALAQEAQAYYAARNAAAPKSISQAAAGANPAGSNGQVPNAAAGSGGIPATSRGASGAGGQAGGPAGNQGLQGAGLRPLTQDEIGQYREARAATGAYKQTYGNGPVGEVLKPGQGSTGYALADADVPAKFFNARAKSPEAIQAFQRAGGNVDRLADYATYSLRDAAINEDGTIDAKKFSDWTQKHAEPLKAFPELQEKFANLKTAQDTLDRTVANHKAAIESYERGAAQNFLKGDDPAVAISKAFKSPNPAQTFRHLVQLAGANATGAAGAGLRRAVVEHIQTTLKGTQEAGNTGVDAYKSDQFQKFVRNNRKALNVLFGPDGVANIENVAADMKRSARSVNSKLPGQSNTAQDLTAQSKIPGHGGNWSTALGMMLGERLGEHLHGALGAVAGTVLPLVTTSLRQAGVSRINQLVDEAMLHPEVARELLAKVPNEGPTPKFQRRLASRLRAVIPAISINSALNRPSS